MPKYSYHSNLNHKATKMQPLNSSSCIVYNNGMEKSKPLLKKHQDVF